MIRHLVALSVAALGGLSADRLAAQTTYTWTGLAPGPEFLAAGNWSPAGGPPGTTGAANVLVNNLNTAAFGSNYGTVGVNLATDGMVTVGRISVTGSSALTLGSSVTTTGLGERFLALRGTTTDLGVPDTVISAVGGNVLIQDRVSGAADATLTVRLGHASGTNIIFADTGRSVTINSRVSEIPTGGTAYGLLKRGGGTLALNGTGNYTGETRVEGGTLLVNSALYQGVTPASATPVVVGFANGERGVLGGTGSIPTRVTVNQIGTDYGTLTAGAAADRTLNTGAVDLNGRFRLQLFGTATEQGSRVDSSGVVSLGAGSVLELALNGLTPSDLRATGVKQYTFLTGTSVGGVFSNATTNGGAVDFSALGFDPGEWTIQYNADRVVLNFAPVPEPGAVLAVGAVAAGLVRLARRRLR